MLEGRGVEYELIGLFGVTGADGFIWDRSGRSVSLPRLLDGRLSFCLTASSCRRSATPKAARDFLLKDQSHQTLHPTKHKQNPKEPKVLLNYK